MWGWFKRLFGTQAEQRQEEVRRPPPVPSYSGSGAYVAARAPSQLAPLVSAPREAKAPTAPRIIAPPSWLKDMPANVVVIDVETTGLHSADRVVSFGALRLATAGLAGGEFALSCVHLIFDPGKKSHPRAEQVHGYDDWLLRHQDQFRDYAGEISDFIHSGDVVVAHNAGFDLGFVDREMALAGLGSIARPAFCTMEGYRRLGDGGSASLNAVCSRIGLRRQEQRHGALEDAWLAMMVYLWLRGCPHRFEFGAIGATGPSNLRTPPQRPEGPLPRRKRRG